MKIPDDLKYTSEHLWVRTTEDGSVLTGITDYAQELLGDIVYVETAESGSVLKANNACGLLESVKAASDLYAPLDSEIVSTNPVLQDSPELINEAPYDTWIFRLNPKNAGDLAKLLTADAYRKLLKAAPGKKS